MTFEVQEEDYKAIFDKADIDNDNVLDANEFSNIMSRYGYATNSEEMEQLFNEIDLDKNGTICLDEFMKAMKTIPKSQHRRASWRRVFNKFDRNQNGFISKDELQKAFRSMSEDERFHRIDWTDIVQNCDIDGQGKINTEEFMDYVNPDLKSGGEQ